MSKQKRGLQRLLSLLLAMLLIVGAIPLTASADELDETEMPETVESSADNTSAEETRQSVLEEAGTQTEIPSADPDSAVDGADSRVQAQSDFVPLSANYTVTKDGSGELIDTYMTLQEAVSNCPDGIACTITVQSDGLDMGSQIAIGENQSVTLASSGGAAIGYSGSDRHFVIAGRLTLNNITLNNTGSGGGVAVTGTLIMGEGSGITNCVTASDGGGVYLGDDGYFEMNGGSIIGNTASGDGGGVFVSDMAEFILSKGTISENTAVNGGGVSIVDDGFFAMSGGLISNNQADDNGGGINSLSSYRAIEITGGHITENDAENGGGIAAATGVMSNAVLSGNTAVDGGGAYRSSSGGLTFTNCEISGNTAAGSGGGVYTNGSGSEFFTDCEISGNSAENGGALHASGSSNYFLEASDIKNNTASGYGGGMHLLGSGMYILQDTTINDNVADEDGGGVYLPESGMIMMTDSGINRNTAHKSGGGVYLDGSCSVMLENSSINANTADNDGGGVYLAGSYGCDLDEDSMISENTAHGDGGGLYALYSYVYITSGTISKNIADGNGGGMYFAEGLLDLNGGFICDNSAANGGGAYLAGTDDYPIDHLIEGGAISGNTAEGNGGGLYVSDKTTLTIADNTEIVSIIDNKAGKYGGGIYTEKYSYADLADAGAYENLDIITSTVFGGNAAGYGSYEPPGNAAVFTKLGFNGTSSKSHILNNDDINYLGVLYITYNANNSTLMDYTDLNAYIFGASSTVLAVDDPSVGFAGDAGYRFGYWSTDPGGTDGGGTSYSAGDLITMDRSITLYAIWELQTSDVSVKYVMRDGSAVPGTADYIVPLDYGTNYVPSPLAIPGYVLVDWKLDGASQGNAAPNILVTDTDTAITLIYGFDSDENDTEDITLTAKYQTADGTILLDDLAKTMNVGDTFREIHPDITGYDYIGYKVDSSSVQPGEPNVQISSHEDDGTVVTYLYEKIQSEVTVKYVLQDGNSVPGTTDYTVTIAYGTNYVPNLPVLTAYSLFDWKLNETAQGNVSPSVEVLDADMTITLVYEQIGGHVDLGYVGLTMKFESSDGTMLKADESRTVAVGNTFSEPHAAIDGYAYSGYKVNGGAVQAGEPDIQIASEADEGMVVIYVYEEIQNGAAVELTAKYETAGGISLLPDETRNMNAGEIFSDTHPAINGYVYSGYKVNGGNLQSGEPTVLVTGFEDEGIIITYIYEAENVDTDQFDITVKHVDEEGVSLGSGQYDYTAIKGQGESFVATAPAIAGYSFKLWMLNGADQTGEIKIASVESDAELLLVYSLTDDKVDFGNDDFVKTPDTQKVKAGETVKYTFKNFGNKWPHGLADYSITDKPDKGLDFASADLPAFTKGSGITYNVVYVTNVSEARTLFTDIPADKPFSFSAPKLANGEYITAVTLQFGTVPEGFAAGDEIQMVFRVWANPPGKTLTNNGTLRYSADDRELEFNAAGSISTITVSGSNPAKASGTSGWVKTGDDSNILFWIMLLSVSAVILGVLLFVKKRKHTGGSGD